MKRLLLIFIVIGLLVLGCDSNKSTASPSFTDTPLGTTTSTPKVSQETTSTGTPTQQAAIPDPTSESETDTLVSNETAGTQLTLPTLSVGDKWEQNTFDMGVETIQTYEVIGEEVTGGKDCYVIEMEMTVGVPGVPLEIDFLYIDTRKVDKATMEILWSLASGESSGISTTAESTYSYEYSNQYLAHGYPYEVGKAWEVTRTENFNMTIMEYDRESITNVEAYGYEVEGIEEITVPAGTFECFKIVKYDDSGTPLETTWQSVTTKGANVKLVDHEDNETWELTSYSWSTELNSLPSHTSPSEPADGVVIFPDSNLEAIIREGIGKPTGEIYQYDLEGFTELRASGKNIKDLAGIEYCTNLRKIILYQNEIRDISPLTHLTTLRDITLIDNQIRDISPLANHTKLERLFIDGNLINYIAPLANLTNLRNLSLAGNRISNVTHLTKLDRLLALNLGSNPISDVSPLSTLTRLTTLSLNNCQIDDITSLGGMVNMREMHLENNEIQDISALSNMSKVYALKLAGNRITEVSPLSGLTDLVNVWLDNNQVSDISPLVLNEGLNFASGVYLRNNPLSDASIYECIPELERRQVEVIWE